MGAPAGSKARRSWQKGAIEKFNRLHVACRIESHHEGQRGPDATISRGPQVPKADELLSIACNDVDYRKASPVPKQAHQTRSPKSSYLGCVGAFGNDLRRGHSRGHECHAADQVG